MSESNIEELIEQVLDEPACADTADTARLAVHMSRVFGADAVNGDVRLAEAPADDACVQVEDIDIDTLLASGLDDKEELARKMTAEILRERELIRQRLRNLYERDEYYRMKLSSLALAEVAERAFPDLTLRNILKARRLIMIVLEDSPPDAELAWKDYVHCFVVEAASNVVDMKNPLYKEVTDRLRERLGVDE